MVLARSATLALASTISAVPREQVVVAETKHLGVAVGLALAAALNVPFEHDYYLLRRGSAFGIGGAGRPVPGLVHSYNLLKQASLQYAIKSLYKLVFVYST